MIHFWLAITAKSVQTVYFVDESRFAIENYVEDLNNQFFI
jgi:hypothetical protein